ncbi:MAG: Fluoroquinolones export ATP-binding protein [Chloroflexi bacterium]|nr:Fluoroquinolones export ATP-binding protein [Chloroflexota bacterium]
MQPIVQVEHLQKSYEDLKAVDDVSFEVYSGEIFGMVGPNGAGKTTTIEIIEGLRKADSGSARVLGMDPTQSREELAERVGVQLQQSALPPRLRVVEALELFGSFYRQQADGKELLKRLGLEDKLNAPYAKLSGGQQQRLFICMALLNKPELVFFDELTTGLDPQARRSMWGLVQEIRQGGATIFLTTHFMEEAERLCDRVLILDHGKVVALDTPEALVGGLGVEKRLVFTLPEEQALPSLDGLPAVSRVERSGSRVIVYGQGRRFASSVVVALEDEGVDLVDLRTEQANLEDVFLKLTGREMRE